MKRFFIFALLGVLAAGFPKPVGYVNDFAEMFSPEFREELEQELNDFEQDSTAEIAVVTVEDLEGYPVEEYAVRLFEDWQIGKKQKDNGVLLLVAEKERQVRIEVGYGLEPVITDGRAGRIIREKIRPNFKKENYEEGVRLAVGQLKNYVREGEPPQGAEAVQENIADYFPFVLSGGLILLYLSAFLGRTKEFVTGGVIGGALGGFFGWVMGGLASILGLGVILGTIGFGLDYLFSKNYKRLKAAGRPTGFWASRGGFSSSGSGFGGFGGGSSGGGGASGSW